MTNSQWLCRLGVAGVTFVAAAVHATTFTVTNTNASGAGSLYQAITDANADWDQDTIRFNIPGAGVHVIDVSGNALPSIDRPVIIDGYSQPGSHPNTLLVGDDAVILIQVKGSGALRSQFGFQVKGGNTLIQGLSVTGFYSAIQFVPPLGGNAVQGCFVGVDSSGKIPDDATNYTVNAAVTLKVSNQYAISAGSPLTTIGGSAPAERNIISGNVNAASITGMSVTVTGNYVGTDPTGTTAVPNYRGLTITGGTAGTHAVIGGSDRDAGNVVSGNVGTAIQVGDFSIGSCPSPPTVCFYDNSYPADYTVISHNLIGTTADSVGHLGNGTGIHIYDSNHTVIGGLDPAAGNVIAFSTFAGVAVENYLSSHSCIGNSILSNRIYGNGTRGIVLVTNRSDPPVPNDAGDSDTGPNNKQNYPILTSSSIANGVVTITGTLNSLVNTQFTIQFFADSRNLTAPNQTYLGSTNVTTDGDGNAAFGVRFPISDANVFINATATNTATGDTSEFYYSPPRLVNISTRLGVQSGDNSLIAGFIVGREGAGVVVRGLGPSLNVNGTPIAGALQDPIIYMYDGSGKLLGISDDWRNDNSPSSLGTLAPSNDRESALQRSTSPGAYTVVLQGKNGGTGVGLVEVYLRATSNYSELVNISTRGFVGTGDNVMIGGFISADSNGPARYVIRAIGPSLASAGITNPLADPVLELHDGNGALIETNDNWKDNDQAAIQDTGLAPQNDAESAINALLQVGAYTAIVRGKDNSMGVALVEVYNLH